MTQGPALANVLPTFRLSSAEVGGAAALAAYQDVHREIFPCRPAEGFSPEDVVVDMTAWHLGRVMFGVIRTSPLVFERTPETVATSGLDHVLIQHYPEGGFVGTAEGEKIEVQPGDICVFDLVQTMSTQTSWSLSHTLMVPRPLFEAVIDDVPALHGMVLGGTQALTILLAAHLTELAEIVSGLERRVAAAAGHGTVAMIATILATLAPRHARPTATAIPSLFRKVSVYIDSHLEDPSLSPATIAATFGLSRATLYRLFDSLGGVADYIRRRRLITAALRLASPEHRAKRVAQIALACGFASESNFSRSFTRQFGISPSEARSRADRIWAAHGWGADEVDPVREFRIWMKTLRP
jgi:AraC-like DNA-binding protein